VEEKGEVANAKEEERHQAKEQEETSGRVTRRLLPTMSSGLVATHSVSGRETRAGQRE
jgi:hypothetical protein